MNADTHALAGAYVLDALTDTEREQFENHLSNCDDCQADVASLREPVAQLAAAVTAAPPAQLRSNVLQAISGVRPLPPLSTEPTDATTPSTSTSSGSTVTDIREGKRRNRSRRFLAAVAAAVVAIGVVIWSPWSSPSGDNPPQLTATERVMQASDAHEYQATVGDSSMTITVSQSEDKAVLTAENMQPAPEGQDYQAWYLDDGKPVSAGVMPTPKDGKVQVLLEGDATKYDSVALSIEPAGGSSTPTTVIGAIALS
ncbi:twin-arginine translocation signal domain-containing protein [Epidermidibacterium keratini]|uniref:Regulator of SigK n=1 Tax=Epidermidibacterium keratini TaxID=1891644 RepID=A0A7L4YT19_9ACTN|nr:anti-sigma factor [Epidermidibacterium keratini]QHC02375.1 twin-arginine translocation signal domain-containing protein [Epidermidibacterium keratini]